MTVIVCEAGQFKKLVAMIRTRNNECRLHITNDGINTRLVDCANVGMGIFNLKSSSCKGYVFNARSHPEIVGLNLDKVAKVISQAKNTTPLTINFEKKRIRLSYDEVESCVHYMDIETIRKEPNPPNVSLDTEFTFDGSLLRKLNGILPGDRVVIIVKDKVASFRNQSGDDEEAYVKMLVSISAKGNARAIYSWDLIGELRNILDKTCVSVEFKTDHPIWLKTETQGIKAEFLFAPRIESD